ncbi:methyltransferase domain-containing protein [Mumia sp. zg.B53]|uniref:class I SAM-dependent methyltransferase n=1 Tax=Mumia sp. zg.B53 TaxID=2855449 RepID=UPI001C6ECEF8|nr:class I SAM-dependent methyltransferase [Mumia sp. zg.B53]MBW9215403.1 methyltransferase domain-containing protein [Mumia sp. zg.B53]
MDSHAWDSRYTEQPSPFGDAPNATIAQALGASTSGDALDLACGDGRHAAWLAGQGWQVDAVDFSPVAITAAQRRWGDVGGAVRWIVGDALAWEPGRRYDLVLIAYFQSQQLRTVLDQARTWLTPRGRLVYLGHARENLVYGVGGPRSAAVLPTVASLAGALDSLEVLDLRHVERVTPDGTAYDVLAVAREFPA